MAADPAWWATVDGMAASVEGWGGIVIATIAQRTERAPAESGGDEEMSVVAVDGDVDRDTAPLLARVLTGAIDDHPRTCLDMCHVDVLDAAGVRALLAADRYAADHGRDFHVRGVHGMPERVLTMLGVHRIITGINH